MEGRVTVLFLDVDLFKVVNDSLGHAAGDRILVELSRRLRQIVRPGDTLARFGGDEFVIVCEDVPEDEVSALVDRAMNALADPFDYEGRAVTITASIGIAVAGDSTDADTLVRDADAAMYRAKSAGRNQAVVFDQGMHEEAAARLEAESGLRRALDQGELRVYYQPVIDMDTQLTVGFEALVRWRHPQLGLLSPDQFIAVAEETGLIVPLGAWVLERALADTARWRATLPGADGPVDSSEPVGPAAARQPPPADAGRCAGQRRAAAFGGSPGDHGVGRDGRDRPDHRRPHRDQGPRHLAWPSTTSAPATRRCRTSSGFR